MLHMVCRPDNDLFQVLTRNDYSIQRYENIANALEAAEPGSGMLSLADSYPIPGPEIQLSMLERAREGNIRLFVEYPAAIPGFKMGEARQAEFERLVVASGFFEGSLGTKASDLIPLVKGTILAMHSCWFLPSSAIQADLVLARVAGYRKIAYGMPREVFPVLFKVPDFDCFVATSKLSQFVTGRYAPQQDWANLWQHLLYWLEKGTERQKLIWQPDVRVEASREGQLPQNHEMQAFQRSIHWFKTHTLYTNEGRTGVIEGFGSAINYRGFQAASTVIRGDCTPETAMVIAWDWTIHHNPESRKIAGQIMDTTWTTSDLHDGSKTSPFGHMLKFNSHSPIFFADDNARAILSSLLARRLLDEGRWDEAILRCVLANFKLTGESGFGPSWIEPQDFPPSGWKYFHKQDFIVPWPHFQAYPLAAYLWAYALSGYTPFYQKASRAIRKLMDVYPHWRWTNGFTQELARMLLPLSFLIRIEDTGEHRTWLDRIATDLLAQMQPCGAIREKIGDVYEDGEMRPPRSNEAYGTGEASLLHQNGDPVCDLLYTMNYAALGLHEAAAATGNHAYTDAEDKLVDFLCRVQARSEKHPNLDGAWIRSFDDTLWEYWGSSSDTGWGAWCVETGWTNTWIASVLAMRQMGASLFNLGTSQKAKSQFPAILAEMIPE